MTQFRFKLAGAQSQCRVCGRPCQHVTLRFKFKFADSEQPASERYYASVAVACRPASRRARGAADACGAAGPRHESGLQRPEKRRLAEELVITAAFKLHDTVRRPGDSNSDSDRAHSSCGVGRIGHAGGRGGGGGAKPAGVGMTAEVGCRVLVAAIKRRAAEPESKAGAQRSYAAESGAA